MAYPRHQASRAHKKFTRTAGDLTLNSGTWADLPTIGTTFDIVLAAQTGDTIEATIAGRMGSEAFTASLDVVTIVAAAFVSSFATQSTARPTVGASPWRGLTGVESNVGGSMMFTLAAGDVSSGTVTLRVQYSEVAAGNKTLYAGTAVAPFHFTAINLGPVDPN